MSEVDDALLDRPFVFRERPISTTGDLRPVWRVPLVLLLVSSCRGERATHEQLHVLNWAVRSAASAEALAKFLSGTVRPDQAVVRFEPALDRAVALAHGFKLLQWKGKYWEITEGGRATLEALRSEPDALADEKVLLSQMPGALSQAAVSRLLGGVSQ